MDGGGHDGNVSVFDKRRGGKGLANGLVDYHIETPDKIKSIFEGAGISTPSYNKLKLNNQQSIDTFKKAIAKAKQSLGNDGASVELKDDYTDINLYLSEDGESGFGIKPNEEKIPYIIDYDDGEKFQHQYKWRSPAEREAIYNNMLKRYKNAKTTEELKKVVFDNDKPIEVFNRQMDDLSSLSKEQAQSINAEYSKRYLELIKEENPEEYKKNKKYLEKKYNIKSDASIYIDSLIDTINLIDAKKKEFKESDVNRDEDGKFATQNAGRRQKNSSSNKSNDNNKSKDNDISKDNDKKENSNPKKSNCNIGDTYNIAINDMATIPAKKIAESNSYELYDEKDYFNKLNSKKKQDLENALQYASEKYDELFNIYGLSDSQPTNKLKVVLISQKDYKDMKGAAGFTLRAGSSEEDDNNIFVNIDTIKKNNMNYINEVLLHETMHAIINDNLRNAKTNERPSSILEEALAETATFIANDKNYRDTDNPKVLLFNKYYFTSNLMHYFYLKNNKNSDIFKDIIEKRQTRFMDAVQDIGNKVGIQGSKADIIKQFLKDKCNITDSDATMFILDLERKMKNPNW